MKRVRMVRCRLIAVMSKVPLISLLFQWLLHYVKTYLRAQPFEEDGEAKVATGYSSGTGREWRTGRGVFLVPSSENKMRDVFEHRLNIKCECWLSTASA